MWILFNDLLFNNLLIKFVNFTVEYSYSNVSFIGSKYGVFNVVNTY